MKGNRTAEYLHSFGRKKGTRHGARNFKEIGGNTKPEKEESISLVGKRVKVNEGEK